MHYARRRRAERSAAWASEKNWQRYEAKVDRSGGPEACHPWTGWIDKDGYGIFTFRNHSVRAHRWGFREYIGPLDDTEVVRHRCDYPACQNPQHWLKGTQAQNNGDMSERGRVQRGERHYRAKLTVDGVRAARRAYANGAGVCALAFQYNVNKETMREVLQRKTWKWVPDDEQLAG